MSSRANATVAIVLAIAAAGCFSSPTLSNTPLESLYVPSQETAIYEIKSPLYEGNLTVAWQLIGDDGIVHGKANIFRVRNEVPTRATFDFSAIINASTGIIELLESGDWAYVPPEWDAWGPNPWPAFATDFDQSPSTMGFFLLYGLQWPLIISGETSGAAILKPCEFRCWKAPPAPYQQLVKYSGFTGGLLPEQASITTHSEYGTIWYNRTSHAVGASADVRLELVDPAVDPVLKGCELLPCANPGWPSRLDVKAGYDAIYQHPSHVIFRTQNPEAQLFRATVMYGPSGVGAVGGQATYWGMHFERADSSWASFSATRGETPSNGPDQPVTVTPTPTEFSSTGEWRIGELRYPPIVSPADVIERARGRWALDADKIVDWQISWFPSAYAHKAHLEPVYTFHEVEGDVHTYADFFATTGQPLRVTSF